MSRLSSRTTAGQATNRRKARRARALLRRARRDARKAEREAQRAATILRKE